MVFCSSIEYLIYTFILKGIYFVISCVILDTYSKFVELTCSLVAVDFPYLYPWFTLKLFNYPGFLSHVIFCLPIFAWLISLPIKDVAGISARNNSRCKKNTWNHVEIHVGWYKLHVFAHSWLFIYFFCRSSFKISHEPFPGHRPGTDSAGVQRGTHMDQEGHRLWGSQLGKAGLRRLRGLRNMIDGWMDGWGRDGHVSSSFDLFCWTWIYIHAHVVYRLYTSSTLATYPLW